MDYDKIVNTLIGKSDKMLEGVLKIVISAHFIVDGIDDKCIKLHDRITNDKYILEYNNRILIHSVRYDNLYLSNDFGFIIEIDVHNDTFTLSNILNVENPEGIITSTVSFSYDGKYKFNKGRICLLKEHDLDALSNKQSIKLFLDNFYEKRSNVFNDLFWDIDLLRKSLLIDSIMNKKIIINSVSDNFGVLYKELLITMSKTMEEVV